MRIVLDTSVVVAALRSPNGASAAIIDLVQAGKITLCLDYKMSCEYRDVTARPEHRKPSGLTITQVGDLLAALEDIAEPIRMKRRYRGLSPDPSDDMVLELAINAVTDVIVTHNLRHRKEPAGRFDTPVYTPAHLLEWFGKGGEHARKKEPDAAS